MEEFEEKSIGAIFQNRSSKYGDKALVSYKNNAGVWEDISWNRMNDMVRNLGLYLISRGIKPQDKVALFSSNRYEWWIADLAILSIGAVNVPIYANNSAEESRFIIENSDSRICLTGSAEQMEKIIMVRDRLPKLMEIILFDEAVLNDDGVVLLKDALKEGGTYTNPEEFNTRLHGINIEDIATIIYTSGTTGNPKGVMLTHNNFISNIRQIEDIDPEGFEQEHVYLSFLPLAHIFERTSGYYGPVFSGKKVAFAEDITRVLDNLREVRPTIIICVPRIYEKIHSIILAKLAAESSFKKAVFNWSMKIARENLAYFCENRPCTGLLALKYKLADRMVFSKLKRAIGMDKLYYAISGGGPLSVSDAEFFLGMGIRILEGFGLTETTPVINVNIPCHIRPGTVGPVVKDTILKIGDDGEILVKGPQVMKGYYKNEAATRDAFTPDGFFKTGDIGEIDSDGCLRITGRIKDLIVTSGGKNISPQNIENSLKRSRYVEQVAVIGDRRKYLSALIVPAFAELEAWADQKGIVYKNKKDLISNDDVAKLMGKEIEDNMVDFARDEQIKKFNLLESEWSQDSGELTPTMKLKRFVINQKFSGEIEKLY